MCLIGLALDANPLYALIVAANRDEFHDRPAAGLDWWRVHDHAPWLLAGRDLAAGGTWMGLAANGRVAMLTNVRDPARQRVGTPSRGALVTRWLGGDEVAALGDDTHNPFNLIGGDLSRGRWWWQGDAVASPQPLPSGVHGLSNAALNTPWPKVERLKAVLADAARWDGSHDASALTQRLFTHLADRQRADDPELPDTGVGLERERQLSSAFISLPERAYGTRCSTVMLGERGGNGAWHLHVTERSFDRNGRALEERRVSLNGWPAEAERPAVRVTKLG
jgi:uncharacterized protein with NRDE domain